ncbi:ABC transporter substrate-binding protein [Amnibacterium endophyticum]|uniref:ABC transporter substrate-binding protein n=1 Tax=Amnibacterium endophyticum TaxID=2109337 RepID=A0ABW4LF21_9MICO
MTRPRPTRRAALAAVGAAALLVLTACSGTSAPAAGGTAGSGGSAAASGASLQTVTPGKLTVATGQPAYSPWVEDDDPSSGKGFESAVTYAVAEQLGYAKSDVVWVRSTFDSAITPGAKPWDMNIQQFSVTPERKQAVDFSSPYYTTAQAVVTKQGSKAASATTLAALKPLRVGVGAATTSLTVATDQLGKQPQVFNSVDDAVQALKNDQIDALVTDLPGAFYIAGAQLDDGVVSAQFASSGGGDQLAYVLPKGSPLTQPVSDAVDALRSSGELQTITDRWLSSEVDVPVLT